MKYAYYDKTGQVAMIADGLIEQDKLQVLEFDEIDAEYLKQKQNGGQLYVKNGKITYVKLNNQPVDAVKAVKDALADAKDFQDFKKKLADKLL